MPEEKSKKDILGHEEVDERAEEREKERTFNPLPSIYLILFIFLLALTARLAVLFFFSEPEDPGSGWYGDVWHHWQIAYLTKEVGLKEGFLRLWDFKGMEYYWGLLHPLVLIAGFKISSSVSILVPRMVSVIFSSLAITLIFLIIARYFNKKAAFASSLFLTLMPVSLFSDTLGMQEPLGLFFLLLGVYLFYSNAFIGGFSWMLAGMVRAEYWLFGAGLLLAVLIREKSFDRKISALIGYAIPLVYYLKYMLDRTGNPIYPIYQNFMASVAGEWFDMTKPLSAKVETIKVVCQVLTGVFLVSGLVVFWRRFKGYLLFLLGFANLAFIFFVFGFGAYLYGYLDAPPGVIDRFWIDRLFAFPWGFLGILVAIFLLYLLPTKLGKLGTLFGTLVFLVCLGATQLVWPSIDHYYAIAKRPLEGEKRFAGAIAENYTGEGTIYIPGGRPALTYSLVYHEGISGEKLVSVFYSPFYYYKGADPFAEWDTFREEIISWLQKHDAELFVLAWDVGYGGGPGNYERMLKLEEGKLFELVDEEYKVYKVKADES